MKRRILPFRNCCNGRPGTSASRSALAVILAFFALLHCNIKQQDGTELTDRPDLWRVQSETTRVPLTDPGCPIIITGLSAFEGFGCWSVNTSTVLKPVFIRHIDRVLMLRAYRINSPVTEGLSVDIILNGQKIDSLGTAPGLHDYKVHLPVEKTIQGENLLELVYSKTYRPSDIHPDSDDHRDLALNYKEILFADSGGSLDPVAYYKSPRENAPKTLIRLPAMLQFTLPGSNSDKVSMRFLGDRDRVYRVELLAGNRLLVDKERVSGFENIAIPVTKGLVAISCFITDGTHMESEILLESLRLTTQKASDYHRKHLILITLDTFRQDYMGCHGHPGIKTPNFDAFARQARTSINAYSHVPITGPAHGSIFAGRYPHELGLIDNRCFFAPETHSLPEILKANGFLTAGFSAAEVLNRTFGYNLGFSYFHDSTDRRGYQRAGEINQRLEQLLDQVQFDHRRCFFWIHYYDTHAPYTPQRNHEVTASIKNNGTAVADLALQKGNMETITLPLSDGQGSFEILSKNGKGCLIFLMEPVNSGLSIRKGSGWKEVETDLHGRVWYAEDGAVFDIAADRRDARECGINLLGYDQVDEHILRDRYGGEVEDLDREFGHLLRILSQRGLLSDSAIIVTGDHGESLGEHDFWGHIHQLFEPLVRIPMLIWPGTNPELIDTPACHYDLLRTALHMLDCEFPAESPESTSSILLDTIDRKVDRDIFCEAIKSEARETVFSLRRKGFHLLHYPERDTGEAFYSLDQDPQELHPIPLNEPGERMRRDLLEWIPGPMESIHRPDMDQQLQQRLRALGYLTQ